MELRVSLLIIGGLIILAIYLVNRRNLPSEERHATVRRASRWSELWQSLRDRCCPNPQHQSRKHIHLSARLWTPVNSIN